jgi:hypothetical protein
VKRPPEVLVTWHEERDDRRLRRVAEILLDIIDSACASETVSTSEPLPESVAQHE